MHPVENELQGLKTGAAALSPDVIDYPRKSGAKGFHAQRLVRRANAAAIMCFHECLFVPGPELFELFVTCLDSNRTFGEARPPLAALTRSRQVLLWIADLSY